MASIPFIPGSAPFSPEQRAWLNGYLVGVFSDANLGAPGEAAAAEAQPKEPLLVMYGSQSGSAEGLAK
jgi:sulfite reductase (NADPH) flavoprotein alpha-component